MPFDVAIILGCPHAAPEAPYLAEIFNCGSSSMTCKIRKVVSLAMFIILVIILSTQNNCSPFLDQYIALIPCPNFGHT
jgi:hypothetical protein